MTENLKYAYPNFSDSELENCLEISLSRILSQEILKEINREVVNVVLINASMRVLDNG